MMARSTTRSNQRPDTLMQDRTSANSEKVLLQRTAGPYMWVIRVDIAMSVLTSAITIHVIPAIPACPVCPKSGHSANARVYEATPLAIAGKRLLPAATPRARGAASLGLISWASSPNISFFRWSFESWRRT